MPKRMPKILFVKREKDGDLEYFTADDDLKSLASVHEARIVGRYELKETISVELETVVHTKKSR